MRKITIKLLLELLKNSNRSDRELAEVLDVSQPTISRMRNRLVKEGVIRGFTVIPDFTKLGYEIVAITLTKVKLRKDLKEKTTKTTMARPNIIFASRAEGLGMNGIMVSLHKSYTDYSNFIAEFMLEWEDDMEEYSTILVSLGGRIVKPFSTKYLADIEI